jgi:type I restriction enzyme M protein
VQQIIKNASDQLNQEGVDARNYVEQIAWLFFLKAFDEAESRREEEAAFDGSGYTRRLAGDYAWSSWAKDTDHPDAMLELANTLELHADNVPERHKYQVILSNPPYEGKLAQQLQKGFRVRSSATECLFVQYIMANLAKGGRAAVIVPEGVLFRGGPDQKVRKTLLEHFRVHTILSLPAGCFLPYTGVKTNVIFFDRPEDGSATDSVWYYELTNDGFELKQTRKPIEGSQIPDFLAKWQDRLDGENSWAVPIADIVERGFDLSARNPNRKDDYEHRPALELVQSIKAKEQRILELLDELESMLQ